MSRPAQLDLTVDYYGVLGIEPTASAEEIRRSYKRLVLQCHPDKNPGNRAWAEKRIRELIQAFEVLGSEDRREVFDRHRRVRGKRSKADVPFFFRSQGPRARSRLILHHLLNRHCDQAVDLLLEMERDYGNEFLHDHLDTRDYLDCLFLLGEYHLAQRDYQEAARRFMSFYQHERASRFPRHYFEEVVRQLKDLYLRKLPRVLKPVLLVGYLIEAAHFALSPREELLRLRKLAEAQALSGAHEAARRSLAQMQRLSARDKDLQRVERLLHGGV
jgi:curved DNA-binding protein CbpA